MDKSKKVDELIIANKENALELIIANNELKQLLQLNADKDLFISKGTAEETGTGLGLLLCKVQRLV